jgi:hypothetical protein
MPILPISSREISSRALSVRIVRELVGKERQGMQGLAQVVAGCGKKPCFGKVHALGFFFFIAQLCRRFTDALFKLVTPGLQGCGHFIDPVFKSVQDIPAMRCHPCIELPLTNTRHRLLQGENGLADIPAQASCQQAAHTHGQQGKNRRGQQDFLPGTNHTGA